MNQLLWAEHRRLVLPLLTALAVLSAVVFFVIPGLSTRIETEFRPAANPNVLFLTPPQAPALSTEEVLRLIQASAAKHNVPAAFIQSIVAAESNFNSKALSPKGAIGLMQLMPDTAKLYGDDPGVAEQNIDAGTHYLRDLMNRYEKKYRDALPRVIAAYNAGPGMVDKYRGIPPFRETRQYVVRVLGFMHQFSGELQRLRRF